MSEFRRLADVAEWGGGRVAVSTLTTANYISTENMLPDRKGVECASALPAVASVSRYDPENVLISNIRPYFKKIWYADKVGGCSNDVLVVKAKDSVSSKWLYYALSTDHFFDYDNTNTSGTKMPRGNRDAIMNYLLRVPSKDEQKRIAAVLSDYDAAIGNCRKQIALLEEAAMRLYREWFGDGKGEKKRLSEVVEFDPPTKLMKGKRKFSVPMGALQVNSMVLDKSAFELTMGNSGSKFKNGDTLLARITPCLENGKTAFVFGVDDDGACGSTEFIVMRSKALNPYVVYLLARTESFRKVAIGSMSGADGRQRARKEVIASFEITVPPDSVIERFGGVCEPIFKQIEALQNLIYRLTEARDRLLPKLMKGEIAV